MCGCLDRAFWSPGYHQEHGLEVEHGLQLGIVPPDLQNLTLTTGARLRREGVGPAKVWSPRDQLSCLGVKLLMGIRCDGRDRTK